ncbi:MAG: X-Pro dipeptidyl-peptidase [Chloroflexota bacterium]|nr:X-Pro dipeptidyl-peptidase [Chloroflexota bacterium]
MTTKTTRPQLMRLSALVLLGAVCLVGGAAPAMAAPLPTEPLFTDGEAQPVFPTSSTSWINSELWIESSIDSDNDGKTDLIHADVSRVQETDTAGLKVPVVLEVSPYYAGTAVEANNWSVDHEIGDPPDSRLPAVAYYKPNTGSISTAQESTWVPRGFAVMHAESVGTGESDGCPTSGGRNETLGARAVIDWINGRAKGYTAKDRVTEVTAYWATGSVGMIGTSYNGTLPNAVATTGVEGLDAIIPVSAISNWYDYYRANGMVRAPGGYQGEDLDVLAEYVYSRLDRTICKGVIADITAHQDRATGDSSAFWAERNYMRDIDNVHAAVLMAHGNNDWNVMTKNMAQFYYAIKARGVPHQLYLHQGGHGGEPPLKQKNRWFTRYLWGVQNGVENDPKAWIVREGQASGSPTPYAEWPDPDMAYVDLNFTGDAPARGELTFYPGEDVTETLSDDGSITAATLTNAASSPNRLEFITAPLQTSIRISGTPLVSLNLASSKPKANVSALIASLDASGAGATIITRGWIDPENRNSVSVTDAVTPGTFYALNWDMQPKDSVIAAGRRLAVVLYSSDNEYTVRPAAGTQLSVKLGLSQVHIPIVGGARALATALGVTAPSVDYTVDPSDPNGQNGWYTTDVSVAWNVADGGAPADTEGCTDTDYTADGQYTASCTATNFIGSSDPISFLLKRDATAPTVALSGVANGVRYVLGSVPTAACATNDATSGVASTATLSLTGGTSSGIGHYNATCSGGSDVAGNAATAPASAAYDVIYNWTGFSGPTKFKAGKPAALTFSLNGNFGLGVVSSVLARQVNCSSGKVMGSFGALSGSLGYSAATGRYTYSWQTLRSSKGTCREVVLTLDDGTSHTTRVKLTA